MRKEMFVKSVVTMIIACSLILPISTAFADQATAPGQQKKEAGDGSAKDLAPSHEKDSADKATEPKGGAKAKSHKEKAHTDKAAHAKAEPKSKTKEKTHSKAKAKEGEKTKAKAE